jgi:calcineurin-like phosphoesterase family protein
MNTWLVSDWHCGEDRFEIMGRPFKTQDEMVDTLIKNHNELVAKDDCVIVVGDVCYQKYPEFLNRVSLFNGRKKLIRGNHDRVITDEQFLEYFEEVIPEGEGIELEIEGIKCYANHYPTRGRVDRFNLTGHVHGAWRYQLNTLNVCVDVHNYRPVNLNKIPFHLKAISEYYDEDVWVAYREMNSEYRGKRGKKGSYLPLRENNGDCIPTTPEK